MFATRRKYPGRGQRFAGAVERTLVLITIQLGEPSAGGRPARELSRRARCRRDRPRRWPMAVQVGLDVRLVRELGGGPVRIAPASGFTTPSSSRYRHGSLWRS
jgi:hypothetical protein